MALRLVIDTNVLVSALLFPNGAVSWMRRSWQAENIVPLVSKETTQELIRVLSYPQFRLSDPDKHHLLAEYLPWCETVVMSEAPYVPCCRDPFDRAFLELAVYSGADALVTGDSNLLSLAGQLDLPILTAQETRQMMDNINQ